MDGVSGHESRSRSWVGGVESVSCVGTQAVSCGGNVQEPHKGVLGRTNNEGVEVVRNGNDMMRVATLIASFADEKWWLIFRLSDPYAKRPTGTSEPWLSGRDRGMELIPKNAVEVW